MIRYLTWEISLASFGQFQLAEVLGEPELRRRRPLPRLGRELDLRRLLEREYVQHFEQVYFAFWFLF